MKPPNEYSCPQMRSIQDPPYSASGNGVDDDTPAFLLAASDGGAFFVPLGRYVIDSVHVTSSVVFTGEGEGSILFHRSGASGPMFFAGAAEVAAGVRQIELANLTLDGNSAYQPFWTDAEGLERWPRQACVRLGRFDEGVSGSDAEPCVVRFDKVNARGIAASALSVSGTGNAASHRCQLVVSDCRFTGILEGPPGDHPDRTHNPVFIRVFGGVVGSVTRSYFDLGADPIGSGATAVVATSRTGARSSNRLVFTANRVHRMGRAPTGDPEQANHLGAIDFYAENDHVHVAHNTFTASHSSAIRGKTSVHRCEISSNTIRDVNDNAAIYLTPSVSPADDAQTQKQCIVMGNIIDMVHDPVLGVGIKVQGLPTDRFQDVMIANNQVYGAKAGSVFVSNCHYVTVSSNQLRLPNGPGIRIDRCEGVVVVAGNVLDQGGHQAQIGSNDVGAIHCVGTDRFAVLRIHDNTVINAPGAPITTRDFRVSQVTENWPKDL